MVVTFLRNFSPAIGKSFRGMMGEGPYMGWFPCTWMLKLNYYVVVFHGADSSAIGIWNLLRKVHSVQSIPKAGPQVNWTNHLKVGRVYSDDHVGDVIGDLNRRRGMIKTQEAGERVCVSKRTCHFQKCFGLYWLTSTMTSGRGQCYASSHTTIHASKLLLSQLLRS